LNKLVKKKNYAKEKQNMWKIKRWLVVIPVVIVLVVASPGVVAAATPWADSHSSNPDTEEWPDLPFVEQEADEVADILDTDYVGFDLHDWSKSWQINSSLPFADLWHFAGHGWTTWYGKPYLVTGDVAYLYGDDIPDLTDPHEFDCMRFAFANACKSGHTSFWVWVTNLHDGFIDNGCEAYLGWDDNPLDDYGAYVYATTFYDLAITHRWTVSYTRTITEYLIGTPGANSLLYGDGSVTITP